MMPWHKMPTHVWVGSCEEGDGCPGRHTPRPGATSHCRMCGMSENSPVRTREGRPAEACFIVRFAKCIRCGNLAAIEWDVGKDLCISCRHEKTPSSN